MFVVFYFVLHQQYRIDACIELTSWRDELCMDTKRVVLWAIVNLEAEHDDDES